MNRGKKRDVLIIAAILLLLIGLTVGYAALSRTLTINGTTTISDAKWNIHFKSVTVTDGSVKNEEGKPKYVTEPATIKVDENGNKTKLSYDVTLPIPGTYYDFTAVIINEGTIPGKLDETPVISGIDEEHDKTLADYSDIILYSVTYDDTAKTPITEGDTLQPDQEVTVRVRVEFKKDITASQLPTEPIKLKLDVDFKYVQV